jgi:ParB family chromosome partitioning protein
VPANKKRGLPKTFKTRYESDYVEELANEKILFKVEALDIDRVKPDVSQPRKLFDEEALKELASSIKEKGVLEPILVRKEENGFIIISGERRWRASIIAGKKTIPAIVLDTTDNREIKEIQIIENLQRKDITPLERARAIKDYLEPFAEGKKVKTLLINYRRNRKVPEKFAHTVSALCKLTGKSPMTLVRWVSLLDLPEEIQKKVDDPLSPITARHVEHLLKLDDVKTMMKVANLIEKEGLSSEETGEVIKEAKKSASQKDPLTTLMKKIERIYKSGVKDKRKKRKTKEELLKLKAYIEKLLETL